MRLTQSEQGHDSPDQKLVVDYDAKVAVLNTLKVFVLFDVECRVEIKKIIFAGVVDGVDAVKRLK
jgi:hypothetical protein